MNVVSTSRLRPTCTARPVCVVRQAPRRVAAQGQRPAGSRGPTPPRPTGALPCAAAVGTGLVGGAVALVAFNESALALSQWALALHFSPEQAPACLGAAVGYGAAALALVPLTALVALHARRKAQQLR